MQSYIFVFHLKHLFVVLFLTYINLKLYNNLTNIIKVKHLKYVNGCRNQVNFLTPNKDQYQVSPSNVNA